MQKSLTKFIEDRPKVAEDLGISTRHNSRRTHQSSIIESESDSEESPKPKRRDKKNCEDDNNYFPDTFSALVGSHKGRKSSNNDVKLQPPVVAKPKLRRVEKKFVPVLEKLSIEELMETNTYDRFNRTMENVLKMADDLDFTEISEYHFPYLGQPTVKSWGFNI